MQIINNLKEKYSEYLPSKKFAILSSAFVVLGVVIFIIFFMSSGGENFSMEEKNKNESLKVENQTLTSLVQVDTDGDGILDWEEALWGTDKNKSSTFGDVSDATYIDNKRKELKIEGSINQTKLTETEKFARDFFSSYSAMKSSGQVDADTINNFSNALGAKVVDPNLIDQYSETDVKINKDNSKEALLVYYATVRALFKNYQSSVGLGEELDIINKEIALNSSTGGVSSTPEYVKLSKIANAYKDFAIRVLALSAPESIKEYHLKVANSSNNTGVSVSNLSKIISDPVIGLSGLSQYRKYSEDLVKTVAELEDFLSSR